MIHRPKSTGIRTIQRHKSRVCPFAEPHKSHWTEEVRFNEIRPITQTNSSTCYPSWRTHSTATLVESTPSNIKSWSLHHTISLLRSVYHRSEPRPSEFEVGEFNQILRMPLIKYAQMEWVAQIVYGHKKDGALNFCLEYQNSTLSTSRIHTISQGWTKVSTLFEMLRYFQRYRLFLETESFNWTS